MMLSYDVAFDANFAFNKGGKVAFNLTLSSLLWNKPCLYLHHCLGWFQLPGMRGGPDDRGCSGGSETDGTTCFSTRLMWRDGGAGEGEKFNLIQFVVSLDQQ